jgi:hypothetical protein
LYGVLLFILVVALGWAAGQFDHMLSSLSPRLTRAWVLHHQAPPDARAPEVKPSDEKK